MVKSIYHININCTNFERSLAFYELLGFRVVHDFGTRLDNREAIERGFRLDMGGKSATRAALLQLAGGGTIIDLIEWKNPRTKTPGYPVPEYIYHVGPSRIALKVEDLHRTYEELKAKGVRFLSEPQGIFVCCTDPDGTVLELLEFPKTSEFNRIRSQNKE
jgi:glyoxylase I family protein